ncbi:hypothetical protein QA597_02500 [Marinilabiliaceae bacterium ANBcel2]|nr:hypothetical protein [Marinilabiliaceae bacterium ANBcel2]
MLEKKELQRLFIQYPPFFYAFISLHYPLNNDHIYFLEKELVWTLIANNEEIDFSIPLIEKYYDRLHRSDLGYNLAVNKKKEILRHFRLKPRSYWKKVYGIDDQEPKNEDYHPKIRYHNYSLIEIEQKKYDICWANFSGNKLIKWNYQLLCKYRDFFYFGEPVKNGINSICGSELYCNEAVPWDVKAILLFEDKLFPCNELNLKSIVWNPTLANNLKPLLDEQMFVNVLCKLV